LGEIPYYILEYENSNALLILKILETKIIFKKNKKSKTKNKIKKSKIKNNVSFFRKRTRNYSQS